MVQCVRNGLKNRHDIVIIEPTLFDGQVPPGNGYEPGLLSRRWATVAIKRIGFRRNRARASSGRNH